MTNNFFDIPLHLPLTREQDLEVLEPNLGQDLLPDPEKALHHFLAKKYGLRFLQTAETQSDTMAAPRNSVHKSYEQNLGQRAARAESNPHQKRSRFTVDDVDQALTLVIQGADRSHKGTQNPNLGETPHRIPQETWLNVFSKSTEHMWTGWANSHAPLRTTWPVATRLLHLPHGPKRPDKTPSST